MTFENAYGETLERYLKRRAWMVWRKLQTDGPLQVRWQHGAIATAPSPAPPGHKHGVYGIFVAVYDPTARLEWIEADFEEFAKSLSATSTSVPA